MHLWTTGLQRQFKARPVVHRPARWITRMF